MCLLPSRPRPAGRAQAVKGLGLKVCGLQSGTARVWVYVRGLGAMVQKLRLWRVQ